MASTPILPSNGTAPQDRAPTWHAMSPEEALGHQQVEIARGLPAAEVTSRRTTHGPNRLVAAQTEPRWQAFLRQYGDPMQVVLLVAGVLSLFLPGQFWTGDPAHRVDAAQRRHGPQPGGQG